MASDRLRKALRAVPDDIKTRHALADAYQVRGKRTTKVEIKNERNDETKFFLRRTAEMRIEQKRIE